MTRESGASKKVTIRSLSTRSRKACCRCHSASGSRRVMGNESDVTHRRRGFRLYRRFVLPLRERDLASRRPASVQVADQAYENVALGHTSPAERIGLRIAGAEVLHADALVAIQPRDRLVDGFSARAEIPCGGAEEHLAKCRSAAAGSRGLPFTGRPLPQPRRRILHHSLPSLVGQAQERDLLREIVKFGIFVDKNRLVELRSTSDEGIGE